MEIIDRILIMLKEFAPYAVYLIPIAAIGVFKMLRYKKYKQFIFSIIALIVFMITRIIETGIFPLNLDSLKEFLSPEKYSYSYIDLISMYFFLTYGVIYLNKKVCPNCKSIDSVKKIGEQLIGEKVINTNTMHTQHVAGVRSVTRGKLQQTYEILYECKKCGYKWTETEKRNKDFTSESNNSFN